MGSDSSGSDDDVAGVYWFHAVISSLYALLSIAAVHRCWRRWNLEQREWPTSPQSKRSYFAFCTLAVYAASRSVVEGLLASESIVYSLSTMEYGCIMSIPGAFFALTQTAMIARWVQTVETLIMALQRSTFEWGQRAVWSSAVILIMFVVLLLLAGLDYALNISGIGSNPWLTTLNFFEGTLYIYNGVCFALLGMLLAYRLGKKIESVSSGTRRRIAAIAVVFAALCISRGILLCLGGAAEQTKALHQMLEYSVAPPIVALVEWVCLVASFLHLQPSTGHGGGASLPPPAIMMDPTNPVGTTNNDTSSSGPPSSNMVASDTMVAEDGALHVRLYESPRRSRGGTFTSTPVQPRSPRGLMYLRQ